jgi:hypothetical protein
MASQQMVLKLRRYQAHADHELAVKQRSLERLCATNIFECDDSSHARDIAAASLRVAWATTRAISTAWDMATAGEPDSRIQGYLNLALNDANAAGGTNHGTTAAAPPLGWPVIARTAQGGWRMA